MSNSSKREARKARQEAIKRELSPETAVPEAQGSATLEEANSKLSETARIINMKQRTQEMAKKNAKAEKATTGSAKTPKLRKDGLPELPKLPKVRSAAKQKPLVPCECGCDETTKSRFAPGHDSYLRGLVARVERKIMTLDDVEKVVGKKRRDVVEAVIAEKKKAERAAKREAKKQGAEGGEQETQATGTDSE